MLRMALKIEPPLARLVLLKRLLVFPNRPPVAFPKNDDVVANKFLGGSVPNRDFGISTFVLLKRMLLGAGGVGCWLRLAKGPDFLPDSVFSDGFGILIAY